MNSTLKKLLTVGAVIAVPGFWLYIVTKRIAEDLDEKRQFKEHIRKNYGEGSKYEYDHRDPLY